MKEIKLLWKIVSLLILTILSATAIVFIFVFPIYGFNLSHDGKIAFLAGVFFITIVLNLIIHKENYI